MRRREGGRKVKGREEGRILVLRRRGGWTVGRNEMQGGRRELGRKVARMRKNIKGVRREIM